MNLQEKTQIEKDCDKPEILEKFNGCCSEEQICKCHGQEMVEKMKKENKL